MDQNEATQVQDAAPSSTEPVVPAHVSIMTRMVTCLRRDFNLLSGELEAAVKDAEKHLGL